MALELWQGVSACMGRVSGVERWEDRKLGHKELGDCGDEEIGFKENIRKRHEASRRHVGEIWGKLEVGKRVDVSYFIIHLYEILKNKENCIHTHIYTYMHV